MSTILAYTEFQTIHIQTTSILSKLCDFKFFILLVTTALALSFAAMNELVFFVRISCSSINCSMRRLLTLSIASKHFLILVNGQADLFHIFSKLALIIRPQIIHPVRIHVLKFYTVLCLMADSTGRSPLFRLWEKLGFVFGEVR
jgi:hypothetical protein